MSPEARYPRLVVATSYLNPFDNTPALTAALGDYRGPVLFDLLFAVGPYSNRFLALAQYTPDATAWRPKVVAQPDTASRQALHTFYRDHPRLAEGSVLSWFDRRRLARGRL